MKHFTKKDNQPYYFERVLLIIFFLLVFLFFFGCVSKPKKDKADPDACYDFNMCLYYNQKNPDKSICMEFAKECSNYRRFEYCNSDQLPNGISFQNCWDKIR